MNKGLSRLFAPLAIAAAISGVAFAGDGGGPPPPPPPGHGEPGPGAVVARAAEQMRQASEAACATMNHIAAEAAQRITTLRRHHAPPAQISMVRNQAVERIHQVQTGAGGRIAHIRMAALTRLDAMEDATDAHTAAVNHAASSAMEHIALCAHRAIDLVNLAVTRDLPPLPPQP